MTVLAEELLDVAHRLEDLREGAVSPPLRRTPWWRRWVP